MVFGIGLICYDIKYMLYFCFVTYSVVREEGKQFPYTFAFSFYQSGQYRYQHNEIKFHELYNIEQQQIYMYHVMTN